MEKNLDPNLNLSYPQRSQSSTDIENINPNFDFEENSPFQVSIMSETFQRLEKIIFSKAKRIGEPHKQRKFNS